MNTVSPWRFEAATRPGFVAYDQTQGPLSTTMAREEEHFDAIGFYAGDRRP